MDDTRLPKCVMFGEMVGGAGCVGGQEKEWMGCFLDDLRAFGINADQWTIAAQDEGEWRRTAEQGAEHFMTKLIVAERTKAELRHAVVCPNVTGRTKKRIAQASGLVLVRSPLLTSHKWRELVSFRRLVCRCHGVFSLALRLFCFASVFVSMLLFGGTLVVGLITKPLGFVQDARDVMALFDEWLGVLGSGVFVCWTIPLQDDTPVCHDCLVVNGTSTFIINISSRYGC